MKKGDFIVVRCYYGGVHAGTLVSQKGEEVSLKNGRRIWAWKGKSELNQIANEGVGEGSFIGMTVEEVILLDAKEILKGTQAAKKSIEEFPAWRV